MTPRPASRLRLLAIVAALAASLVPARALVGAAPDGRFADRVAMVLIRGPGEAGFCSALVLSPRILITAAHCLRPLRDMAVHYRDASGAAVIIPVEAAVAHPLYRPDAIQKRVESIDLATLASSPRQSRRASRRRSATRRSSRAMAPRARATGRRAARCAALRLRC